MPKLGPSLPRKGTAIHASNPAAANKTLYANRIAKLESQGFTRTQARGKTGGTGQLSVSQVRSLPPSLRVHGKVLLQNKDKEVKSLAIKIIDEAKDKAGINSTESYDEWRQLLDKIGVSSEQIRAEFKDAFVYPQVILESAPNKLGTIVYYASDAGQGEFDFEE